MNKRITIFLAVLAMLLGLPALQAFAADYDALLPLLVDLPGWEAEPAEWADASAEGVRTVIVYRGYASGDRRFEVSLVVGMQAELTWLPDYQEGYRVQTPEGLMEVKKIAGFLVYYTFEAEDNSGGIAVLLQPAGSKPEQGAVLAVDFQGLPLEEALKTVQRFNWAKMKEQAGKLK